jgi:hypothetical protein
MNGHDAPMVMAVVLLLSASSAPLFSSIVAETNGEHSLQFGVPTCLREGEATH